MLPAQLTSPLSCRCPEGPARQLRVCVGRLSTLEQSGDMTADQISLSCGHVPICHAGAWSASPYLVVSVKAFHPPPTSSFNRKCRTWRRLPRERAKNIPHFVLRPTRLSSCGFAIMSSAGVEAKRPKLDGEHIVTHNGTHHADEALAVHLLRKLPQYAQAAFTRTRDPSVIDSATIVVDVGAVYDHQGRRYDHHQRGFEETFDAKHKTKLSSAGLVWKHYGKDILAAHLGVPVSDERVELLYQKLYDDFTDLSSRVGYLNAAWNEELPSIQKLERPMPCVVSKRASSLAGGEFFDRVDHSWRSWLPARAIIEKALKTRKEGADADPQGRLLIFDDYASWKSHIYDLEDYLQIPESEKVLYVVYPDESGKWRVQCVPESADSFVSRKPLPEPWRGVRDEELSKLSGIEGCIFVHQSGFIGGNQTRQGALKMAHTALAEGK
ncbi:hypothetical protein IEQ34_025168 [Dendrobium chrysotoxum]|uniref:Metal-dependent protein hydrolase n=1 Tax=Dendrobium chrysotoxum TaxID=161865 RepID=A0AAV7FQM8_DENCH|nr:hypothetical protein IEQ34_025168 [Dendrobium chrysotoxum]